MTRKQPATSPTEASSSKEKFENQE
jgi:hypothetical protein